MKSIQILLITRETNNNLLYKQIFKLMLRTCICVNVTLRQFAVVIFLANLRYSGMLIRKIIIDIDFFVLNNKSFIVYK